MGNSKEYLFHAQLAAD